MQYDLFKSVLLLYDLTLNEVVEIKNNYAKVRSYCDRHGIDYKQFKSIVENTNLNKYKEISKKFRNILSYENKYGFKFCMMAFVSVINDYGYKCVLTEDFDGNNYFEINDRMFIKRINKSNITKFSNDIIACLMQIDGVIDSDIINECFLLEYKGGLK